ncbi:hypothetical protein [Kribbella deserti]|uniref:PH domain-containing protein n=1 Tax=Kribbella deserti TaxID=1926257 RepID=A0ABV6QXX7_9ACTN
MDLRPLLVSRIVNLLPGLTVAVLGAVYGISDRGVFAVIVAVLAVAAGGWLAVRGYHLGARLDDDAIEVRGLFRTQRVDRERIDSITDLPGLVWKDDAGRKHWTPIIAFAREDSAPLFKSVIKHNQQMVEQIQAWGPPPQGSAQPRRALRRTREKQ